ncbi:phage virion morphogenesis protein [Mergibacter septicus]|uniref:Phage virion morphogenesis protein n=1 Tax=Mergibacter septicus TaxID=221402 RepID=A0A8D4IX52_9PAST|nr:phage virion morphogenesis protein [Mergibacter septicus]AWX15226.1 phage virion morphogenesis protein [Mergibacter septicus]QDJ14480.1 phage virion morphogenesis protein [Mergibacter septicus]UTU48083.1 phage virion morphogenesis protein [Mergibacter septicus]WMR96305.1 phage virion morphogenesis protein [Mergibacter septicus]
MIKIQLKNELASKQIAQIATQLQKPRQLYGVLGETLKKIHQERFKQEVDPEGKKWQALSPQTKAQKAKRRKSTKILRQDGYLSDKLAYNYDEHSVEFGSDAKYARLHQFGGKTGKGKKVTIPQRRWLGVSQQDKQILLRKATALLQRQIEQVL